MMLTDRDILAVEPNLFSDGSFSSQVLCGGTNGIVSGTQFTASGVDFTASGVAAGGVIWLESADGSIAGGFEIVTVTDSTHLVVSILRSDTTASAIPVGVGSGLTWRIKTLSPQIAVAETALSHRLRCLPAVEDATQTLDDLDNPKAVKLGWLYTLLAGVFSTLVGTYPAYSSESASAAWDAYQAKYIHYQKQAELLLRQLF